MTGKPFDPTKPCTTRDGMTDTLKAFCGGAILGAALTGAFGVWGAILKAACQMVTP